MKTSIALVLGFFAFFSALKSGAASTSNISTTTSGTMAPETAGSISGSGTSTSTLEKAPTPTTRSQIVLGFKSTNVTGRFGDLNDDSKSPSKGLRYNGKQEVFAGYRMRNNWGGFVQITQYRREFNESSRNGWVASDPSFSLIHPDLFKSDSLTIKGLLRAYLPYTDRSKKQNIRQYAYYSTQSIKMANGAELTNQFIPRLFAADSYVDLDTRFYVEDRTVYVQSINSWSRWGLGQWAQAEQHANAPTGYSLEIIPQIDFIINPATFIGPRIALPVFSQNFVYDGPRDAKLEQARAELYFQMSL